MSPGRAEIDAAWSTEAVDRMRAYERGDMEALPAAAELEDVVAYYNEQSEALGYQLAVVLQKTVNRIAEFPEAWPLLSERTRRCRLRRFPYGVIYHVVDDPLLVIDV